MLQTILVPLDGTPEAARALPHASLLAERIGPGARLVLVRPVPLPFGADDRATCQGAVAEAAAYLAREVGALGQTDFEVATLTPVGPFAERTLQEAEMHGADLVVAATHGRWGMDRLVHGSVAEHLLRHARMPVLLVGPRVVPRRWLRRIVVPLDGDAFAAAPLRPIGDLAAALDVPVDLVGVVPSLTLAMEEDEVEMPAWGLDRLQLRRSSTGYTMLPARPEVVERVTELEARLTFWSHQAGSGGEHPRVHTYYGTHGPSLAATIIHAARELQADVIALRTHARPPVSRLLLGSVADEIVRTSPVPTLLYTTRMLGGALGENAELEHLLAAV